MLPEGSKPQTIDSGSSHYSTLFKEHPATQDTTSFSRSRFPHLSAENLPAILHRNPCIGMVKPDSSVESSGLMLARQNSPIKGPLRKDGAFNIASILCLSMLFSKISRKNSRTPLRRTLPRRSSHRPLPGSLNDHSPLLKVASESSG